MDANGCDYGLPYCAVCGRSWRELPIIWIDGTTTLCADHTNRSALAWSTIMRRDYCMTADKAQQLSEERRKRRECRERIETALQLSAESSWRQERREQVGAAFIVFGSCLAAAAALLGVMFLIRT